MIRQILIFIAVWAVALSGLVLYLNREHRTVLVATSRDSSSSSPTTPEPPKYQCEGKRKCSEMNSCEEALFYLQNCSGTIMDGDNDGMPCENQLCEENGNSNYSATQLQRPPGDENTFSSSYGRTDLTTFRKLSNLGENSGNESYSDSSSNDDYHPVSETSSSQCLGKTRCSEMTSCAEAIFYLQNCPGTQMDGDGDGKPCEDMCGH